MESVNADERIQKYQQLVMDFYMHPSIKFNPNTGYTYRFAGIPFMGNVPRAIPKVYISDVDGVYEKPDTPSLWMGWLSILGKEFVPKIRTFLESERFKKIREKFYKSTNIKEPAMEVIKELSKSHVNYQDHLEASKVAARKLNLVTGTLEFREEIREIGYRMIGFITGAPQEAVQEFCYSRMGFPITYAYGTKYPFKDGKLIVPQNHEDINLGWQKVEARDKFVRERLCVPEFLQCLMPVPIMSDDPHADEAIATQAGFNPVFWTDLSKGWGWRHPRLESKKRLRGMSEDIYDQILDTLPGKVKVYLPEARDDVTILTNYLKRYELARLRTILTKPREELDIVRKADFIRELGKKAMEVGNGFPIFADHVRGFIDPLKYLFPRDASEIDSMLNILERSQDIESDKNLTRDILSILENHTPEFQVSQRAQRFREKLEELTRELNGE